MVLNWDEPFLRPKLEKTPLTPPANITDTLPSDTATIDAAESLLPINPEDKRVINGQTDINQLAPFRYPWAWNFFLNANKNHWTPMDINMAQDVVDFRQRLTIEERHVYENVLAYLTTSDILAMRNIGLAVMEKNVSPRIADLSGTSGVRRVTAYLDLPTLH